MVQHLHSSNRFNNELYRFMHQKSAKVVFAHQILLMMLNIQRSEDVNRHSCIWTDSLCKSRGRWRIAINTEVDRERSIQWQEKVSRRAAGITELAETTTEHLTSPLERQTETSARTIFSLDPEIIANTLAAGGGGVTQIMRWLFFLHDDFLTAYLKLIRYLATYREEGGKFYLSVARTWTIKLSMLHRSSPLMSRP